MSPTSSITTTVIIHSSIIHAARIVCVSACPRVRLSVCPVKRQQQRRAAGLLLSAASTCSRYRTLAAGAALSSICGQRRMESGGTRLHTDSSSSSFLLTTIITRTVANSVIGVSRPPVLDCGTTFHPDYGGRDLPSTPSDNL